MRCRDIMRRSRQPRCGRAQHDLWIDMEVTYACSRGLDLLPRVSLDQASRLAT
jgi:hypothetical protein